MAYTKISGVYKITCSPTNKVYVGSAVSIKGRWATHKCSLRQGKHTNRHLQNAYNKYGEDNLTFSIVEVCEIEHLIAREQYWMDSHKAYLQEFGMNNSPTASTTIGFRHSEETKKLLSAIAKKKDHSRLRELSAKMKGRPAWNKGMPGRKWTEKQHKDHSDRVKGRPAWNKGGRHTAESKLKISTALFARGGTIPDEVRRIICALRYDGADYLKLSKFTGVSLSQCQKIYVGAYRMAEKVKGAEGNR